jgi:GNAT superfamily N-acetyltransferase
VATICDVAVLPEWQGKGYGLRLVRYLLNRMREGTRIGDVGPSSFAVRASYYFNDINNKPAYAGQTE